MGCSLTIYSEIMIAGHKYQILPTYPLSKDMSIIKVTPAFYKSNPGYQLPQLMVFKSKCAWL